MGFRYWPIPFTLKLKGQLFSCTEIIALKEKGLGGLEVFYPEHSPERCRTYRRLAEELDLVATGGSDFHGAVSPGVEIGRGFGNLHVPDSVVAALESRLHAA